MSKRSDAPISPGQQIGQHAPLVGKVRKLAVLVLVLAALAACTSDASADKTICEAIRSVDIVSSPDEAAEAVRAIKAVETPDSELLADVQSKIEVIGGDNIALAAEPDQLAEACREVGITLDLARDP